MSTFRLGLQPPQLLQAPEGRHLEGRFPARQERPRGDGLRTLAQEQRGQDQGHRMEPHTGRNFECNDLILIKYISPVIDLSKSGYYWRYPKPSEQDTVQGGPYACGQAYVDSKC